ncbi:MAG: hypothetical protein ACXABI_03870 [Candidatus Hodarchaeales archaeon]|jgi:SepF-like predicted cell division protein (DUF552 family)
MSSLLSNIRNNIHKPFKNKNQRVRCISIQDIRDTDEIELEMLNQNMVVLFFREFRIKKSLEAKRFLQCLNALIRQHKFEILNLGNLDYLLLIPSSFKITANSLISNKSTII